jgi:hypothetical protein
MVFRLYGPCYDPVSFVIGIFDEELEDRLDEGSGILGVPLKHLVFL